MDQCLQASSNSPVSATVHPRSARVGPSNDSLHKIPSLQQVSGHTVELGMRKNDLGWVGVGLTSDCEFLILVALICLYIFKHCQRHNGPRLLSLNLGLSLLLNKIQIPAVPTLFHSLLTTYPTLCTSLSSYKSIISMTTSPVHKWPNNL